MDAVTGSNGLSPSEGALPSEKAVGGCLESPSSPVADGSTTREADRWIGVVEKADARGLGVGVVNGLDTGAREEIGKRARLVVHWIRIEEW